MDSKREFSGRAILVYLIAIGAMWMLWGIVWGGAGGLIIGKTVGQDLEYREKVEAFLKERGIETHGKTITAREAYKRLSPQDREELDRLTRQTLSTVNWFVLTLLTSAVVFGLLGFFSGFLSKAWILAGAIPIASFFASNPIGRSDFARLLPGVQKMIIVVVQFGACYGLAYLGARLGVKRESANN